MKNLLPVLFILLSVFAPRAHAQTASFTATQAAGCAPLVDTFTSTSTPGATSYYWDFGDGFTAWGNPVSTSYLSPGTYTVTLTVNYPGGVVRTSTTTITVYPPPTVSFYASDTVVCACNPITFTSTTIPGTPGSVTNTWDFGDGSTSTLASPSHTYCTPGYYNITLVAINSQGCEARLTRPAYIHVVPRPVVSISAGTTYFCTPPATTTFTSTVSGTAPFTYSWDFGDGGTSASGSPSHTYTATGTYTVRLVVTDAGGCSDTATMTIVVDNIRAGFSGPDSACANTPVTFTDTSSAHTSASWTYGDGGSGAGDPGAHTYTAAGTYVVTLTVSDGPCTATITHTIHISAPAASFTITPAEPCPAPATLTFTATTPPGATVAWSFGDGGTGSGTPASHTYARNAIYTITMTVTDPATGCRIVVTRSDTIYDLFINLTAAPLSGCVPLTVHFNATAMTHAPYGGWPPSPYPYGVASYSWTFGDGGTGSGSSPSHTYTAVGTYWAVVTITTNNGCVATDSIKIRVGQPPDVTLTAMPLRECYHDNLFKFYVTVITGPIDSLVWDFGDGSGVLTLGDTVYHHYTYPDTFDVTVIPYYNGCPGPPRRVVVTVDSPKAIMADTILCVPPGRVKFFDSSLGDDSRVWVFGDGATSTLANPIHDYSPLGVYTVTLAAYNSRSGCRDTVTKVIDLRRPTVSFVASDTNVCNGVMISLSATVTGGSATSYSWTATGPVTLGGSSNPWWTSFSTDGIYSIRLVITDQNGCPDTVTRPNYIRVEGPTVSFTAAPSSGCAPLTVTFTDASTDAPWATLTSYSWTFGDGTTATTTLPSIAHTFIAGGTYTTMETVIDNYGCSASTSLRLVTVYHPTASFTVSNANPCPGDVVNFTSTSTGAVSYHWTFGDGGTSTLASPSHAYAVRGSYVVTLSVTDAHGCHDTSAGTIINVNKPVASFTMSDSTTICPPLLVYFTNTSTGAVLYNWNFGNGTLSTFTSPSNLYAGSGYDTVTLIAINAFGCADTAYAHVNIFGYAGEFNYGPDSGCSPLAVHFSATVTHVSSIKWDFSDGTVVGTGLVDTVSHLYVRPGAYIPKLILSDNTGCQNSSLGLDTIKVDAVFPGFKTNPDPVCIYDNVGFIDTSRSYWRTITSLLWTFSDGSTSTVNPAAFTYTAAGTFPVVLQATDAWGCIGIDTAGVLVYPLPVITTSPDTTICRTDDAAITAYGGVKYAWTPVATLNCSTCNPAIASPTVATTYTVTGTDAHGCANIDTVTIFIKTKTVSKAWGDTAICRGATVPLFDSGGNKYTWLPPAGLNKTNIADPAATPSVTTTYMAIAKLAGCDPDTGYVTVTVHQLPTVDAGPDQRILAGQTAQLDATGTLIATYAWSDAATLSCENCFNPVASMSVSTTYFIKVASDFGCPAGDSVHIYIYCDASQLFIPNAFTPNGDGQNDVFYPRGSGLKIIKTFRIYNRWGELMFAREGIMPNDASNAWDGSYQGAPPRPDVYVYIIEAICDTGDPINVKGDVTIIK